MAKKIDHAAVRATFEATKTAARPQGYISKTAEAHGITKLTAKRICRVDPRKGKPNAVSSHLMRAEPVLDRVAKLPAIESTFLSEARTRYPHSVISAEDYRGRVLKPGENAPKIGGRVTKGEWAGMPVFTLTLEERATCPTSCRHWRSCYGNGMNWAQRFEPGAALERRLWTEVHELGRWHPQGFAVRLHVLGDFYSQEYVALWGALLDAVPALRVWGYTARWDGLADPIAYVLVKLAQADWQRFAMRFSNAPIDECNTVSIEHPMQAPAGAVVCPQQTGATASCGTCALCWSTRRPIAFLQH